MGYALHQSHMDFGTSHQRMPYLMRNHHHVCILVYRARKSIHRIRLQQSQICKRTLADGAVFRNVYLARM